MESNRVEFCMDVPQCMVSCFPCTLTARHLSVNPKNGTELQKTAPSMNPQKGGDFPLAFLINQPDKDVVFFKCIALNSQGNGRNLGKLRAFLLPASWM